MLAGGLRTSLSKATHTIKTNDRSWWENDVMAYYENLFTLWI